MSMENTCCFTGHRPDKLYGYNPSIQGNYKILIQLKENIIKMIDSGVDTFISGMALGIDTWAARIVLKLKETYPHIKLVAAIPCANHSGRWVQSSKDEWQMIVDRCDTVHYVSDQAYTHWCMQDRNVWMVDNSKYVIAVWDGTKGGTANCVKYAEKKDKNIEIIRP